MRDSQRTIESGALALRHLRFGWWSLLAFLSLGILLEGLHGFKAGWYLDVGNDTRRLLLRLAHAHGTLLALVNVVFGLAANAELLGATRRRERASSCLLAATVLVPLGFLLGGLGAREGDPGLGILLVPIGAALLVAGVFLTIRSLTLPGPPAAAGSPKRGQRPAER